MSDGLSVPRRQCSHSSTAIQLLLSSVTGIVSNDQHVFDQNRHSVSKFLGIILSFLRVTLNQQTHTTIARSHSTISTTTKVKHNFSFFLCCSFWASSQIPEKVFKSFSVLTGCQCVQPPCMYACIRMMPYAHEKILQSMSVLWIMETRKKTQHALY